MRLTSLEIKGFKSFGDKVTIHFDKGVTSIVGPNGSGKSNVVDAMRWVLGEQKTRMLRSEKMENIIFNGTKNRKPANLAEVSLSFENTKNILPTEFSTVTITRKLYRTGESEYLLNGVACRLKDITDLFLDTGIGSDSYSIIELKMIDEIINDKNNTIKMLFEEAAGISKYKVRKKQTLQKLEETDADLNRVNDLLFEIEKNLKTLETQAKKTERYYKIREQYKELSTQLASLSINSYKVAFENLHAEEIKQNDVKIAIDASIDTIEANLQQIKTQNLDNEKHLSASQKALNDKINFIRQYENEKKIKNERLKFLKDKEEFTENQIIKDKNYIEELTESLKSLSSDKEIQQLKVQELEIKLRALKETVDKIKKDQSEAQNNHNTNSQQLQNIQSEIFRIEKLKAVQQSQKDSLKKELDRITLELQTISKDLDQINEQLSSIINNKEKVEENLESLNERETQELSNKDNSEKLLKVEEEKLVSLNRKLDSKQNEFNLTKSLVDSLEGFPESIKYLKKNVSFLKEAPLLSDIIYCKQEYKIAIENFLEPFMNHFVVDSLEQAYESLNILDEKKQGRAQFLVLDLVSVSKKSSSAPTGNYTAALDVIDFDKKYESLCRLLLNEVYIAEEDQNKVPFASDGTTVLSINGKYQRSGFTLGGGSVGLFEGKKIGRGKNLEILQKEIEAFTEEKKLLSNSIEAKKLELTKFTQILQDLSKQKKTVLEEYNRVNNQSASLLAKREQLESTTKNSQKRLEEIQNQISLFSNQGEDFHNLEEQYHILEQKKNHIQKELEENQAKLNEYNFQYNEHSSRFNQENISLIQEQNKASTINRELNYKQTQTESLSKQLVSNSEELEKLKKQIFEIVETSSDGDDSIIQFYEEKESLEKAVAEIESQYFKTRGRIDELENEIRNERKKKEQVEVLIQNIKEKVTEIKIQLNSLKERLKVEFEIDIEQITDLSHDETLTEADLKEKTDRIKNQLNNYGPINPMAIEAYNEINERYKFILSQKEDLLNAKNTLLQTIAEIDNTAKEKFMEAYIQIRENFINVFRSLFSSEDKCDLTLADPSNPLESDINIVAQPKGKRPLSINQLSGGEKTLTATALLFGIYLLKPAPFCIFDEVDAPLDDNNIDKFNKIIKKFSSESQFIIITHNKRTMASTDIIYGVTMIELGVTQVVPVDIREVEAA